MYSFANFFGPYVFAKLSWKKCKKRKKNPGSGNCLSRPNPFSTSHYPLPTAQLARKSGPS
jgi:hypothetical protein